MPSDQAREARFRDIYDQHVDVVRRYVWRRDPLIADDVVAETYLVAWRRIEDVPDDAAPWLIGVARNIRQNERRRGQRQTAVQKKLAREPPPIPEEPNTVSPGVGAALRALPERDREILLLSVWEDLDRGAIAAALGCSTANVSVRLHRARRRFTDELKRQTATSSHLRPGTLRGGSDV